MCDDKTRGNHPESAASSYPDGHPCRECDRNQDCERACPARLRHWDETMARIRAEFGGETEGDTA